MFSFLIQVERTGKIQDSLLFLKCRAGEPRFYRSFFMSSGYCDGLSTADSFAIIIR